MSCHALNPIRLLMNYLNIKSKSREYLPIAASLLMTVAPAGTPSSMIAQRSVFALFGRESGMECFAVARARSRWSA